jgi:hypothetical protein
MAIGSTAPADSWLQMCAPVGALLTVLGLFGMWWVLFFLQREIEVLRKLVSQKDGEAKLASTLDRGGG